MTDRIREWVNSMAPWIILGVAGFLIGVSGFQLLTNHRLGEIEEQVSLNAKAIQANTLSIAVLTESQKATSKEVDRVLSAVERILENG